MRSERYKNLILTVIAVLLALLVARDYVTPARADGPVEVKIVGIRQGYPWDAVKVQQGR